MNYEEALEYIHGTYKFGIKLGLDNISKLLGLMGNPQDKLKYVHVAGTNGKGSTVAYISSILIDAGYKVGIYTSPYIERFTERIKINGVEISEEDLARITEFVKSKVDIMLQNGNNHPTEFEVVTAVAFQYYYEMGCDVVVLEVGLGGRFDSTNVIKTPLLSVIATINYDHMDKLGDTLEKIAFEKAGIIKDEGDVLFYPCTEGVERVFLDKCELTRSKHYSFRIGDISTESFGIDWQEFSFENYKGLKIKLLGKHQIYNAALAVKACEILSAKGLGISEKNIRSGLENARWPGRLEVIHKKPVVIIDGAHNPEAASALVEALKVYFPEKKINFIFGVLKDKDYQRMIEIVAPLADRFITVTPPSERALPAIELVKFIEPYCNNVFFSDKIKEAVKTCLQNALKDDVICVFGSLTFIGEIRKSFVQN